MKQCGRCGENKGLEAFANRSASKDGKSNWCKECFKAYDRERYLNGDKARKDANRKARIERLRSLLWDILITSNCKVCGNSDPEVLEFDHREQSSKDFNVCEMLKDFSWERVLEEIDKCDILCANCHRKRTIRQLGYWRGNMTNRV